MSNTTYSLKAQDIQRKWYIIDAQDRPLGRVATEVARLLKGKHKVTYTPNMDNGDHVIVINSDKVILTGKKMTQKVYRHHTGFIGGLKETLAKDMIGKKSDKAIMLAVKGMLPKNSLGRQMITKVRVYKGSEHNQEAQKPEIWNF